MKTASFTHHKVPRQICLIDASGKVLGRLAAEIAHRLRGKHKPEYTPHADLGDTVIVTNAAKVVVTGAGKPKAKMYHRHSGYPGGLKSASLEKMLAEKPQEVIRLAVRGMLPSTPLGRAMARKLRVYAGAEHPHEAQNPEVLKVPHAERRGRE